MTYLHSGCLSTLDNWHCFACMYSVLSNRMAIEIPDWFYCGTGMGQEERDEQSVNPFEIELRYLNDKEMKGGIKYLGMFSHPTLLRKTP